LRTFDLGKPKRKVRHGAGFYVEKNHGRDNIISRKAAIYLISVDLLVLLQVGA
jgi:hypothetical protein